jgi:ribonuclease P protein component
VKLEHLKKKEEFDRIFNEGKRARGKAVALFYAMSGSPFPAKAGVAITKKMVPLATRRNYMRRVVYSTLEKNKEKIALGAEIVVKIIRPFEDITRRETGKSIAEDLLAVAGKAGILK